MSERVSNRINITNNSRTRVQEGRVCGEGAFTLSASQDQTMDWFPIPNVPFFLLFR